MQGGSRLLRDFIRKNRQIYLFALFPLIWLAYFLSASRQCERMLMHCPLDGLIPFLPVFIIPYVLWYLYVPTALLLNCFSDPAYFKRQCVCFFGGAGVCLLVIMLFPTAVDFRPEINGGGIFSRMCGIIFSMDDAVCVFPSLHCYEALCAHLTAFASPGMRGKRRLRAASAVLVVLICLSTVFIKQHSVIDLAAGCAAAVIAALPLLLAKKKRGHHDNKTV